jgi:Uri superfamily endonuclease
LAQRLGEVFHSVPGFGSSDCICPSHLFFFEELLALQKKAAAVFKGLLHGGGIVVKEY